MKYWYDCEFMEDGKTIDLLSIGIVAEDGREFYAVNSDADLNLANDWVKENVIPFLRIPLSTDDSKSTILINSPKFNIRIELEKFCDLKKYGKPEFWGYYSAYDHVALCQLFGKMIDLPDGWPMYTKDIKQLCDFLGNPKLPETDDLEHNALADARWNKLSYEFLINRI